jgi:hypothetical protein
MADHIQRPTPPLVTALKPTRASYVLLSVFALTLFVIGYVWWPLAEDYLATYNPAYPWWLQMDWLLVGIFLTLTVLLMIGADLKQDALIVVVGLVGGLAIEGWGTQTNLWHYYTQERPPLWIIPAWPIASLAIDRLYRLLMHVLQSVAPRLPPLHRWLPIAYWLTFGAFYGLMLAFVWPTLDKSLTLAALLLCALLSAAPKDHGAALLIFAAGAGLGYFLELWGTTRACWIYYTGETPPLFAVLAHGMAAVAFWRTGLLLKVFWQSRLRLPLFVARNQTGDPSDGTP